VIQERYRRDYNGEFLIVETKIVDGVKQQIREWVPNQVENNHISGRAAVIGSSSDKMLFDYRRLAKHRGGLQGKKKLQTYGTNGLWRDIKLEFYISCDDNDLETLKDSAYNETTLVYTNTTRCLKYPNQFYLIPFSPYLCDLALAIYLAAFDNHREIFMIGYNNDIASQGRNWQQDVNAVIQTYSNTQFVLVGVESNMPEIWRHNRNVSCQSVREFVTYCDV
jgi:hypothetical protein